MPDLFVTTHDLQLGMVRHDCPWCQGPLVMRLPSMQDAIADQVGAALRFGLTDLTATRRAVFDAIHKYYPRGIEAEVVEQQLGVSPDALRMLIQRMRPTLERAGWQLRMQGRALRLIALERPR
jgi:hypothetical protein